MCENNVHNPLKNSINKIDRARMILYDLRVFIKYGALASDSNIIDEDIQV